VMAKRKAVAEADDPTQYRTLPHNIEAEKAVLGAVLINNAMFERAAQFLKPTDFFRRAHASIFEAFTRLIDEQRRAVDLVTIADELNRAGEMDECGGPAYLSSLTDGVPRSANIVYYAGIVREQSLLRQVITAGNRMLVDAYDAERTSKEIIVDADRAIIALQRGAISGRMLKLGETYGEFMADLEKRGQNQGSLLGVDTGFQSINDNTMGWQPSDVIVLAARPSIGKTAFVLNTAIAAARTGKTVAVFSLEMGRRQLEYRMLSTLSQVALTRLQSGFLGEPDFERMVQAGHEMAELPIFIDDTGGQTAWDIRSSCRLLRAEHGLDLVIIDYVQLIPGTLNRRGATRNEEVTDISRRIKELAKELSVPIILCSQLSRASDARADARPRLTDLRESGALEQDADIVAFLHRKHHRESGTTNFIIDKARNGDGGTLNLTINRDTQTFTDGGEDPPPEEKPEKEAKPKRAKAPIWVRTRKGED
jgi:replicative DNA helicase